MYVASTTLYVDYVTYMNFYALLLLSNFFYM